MTSWCWFLCGLRGSGLKMSHEAVSLRALADDWFYQAGGLAALSPLGVLDSCWRPAVNLISFPLCDGPLGQGHIHGHIHPSPTAGQEGCWVASREVQHCDHVCIREFSKSLREVHEIAEVVICYKPWDIRHLLHIQTVYSFDLGILLGIHLLMPGPWCLFSRPFCHRPCQCLSSG